MLILASMIPGYVASKKFIPNDEHYFVLPPARVGYPSRIIEMMALEHGYSGASKSSWNHEHLAATVASSIPMLSASPGRVDVDSQPSSTSFGEYSEWIKTCHRVNLNENGLHLPGL